MFIELSHCDITAERLALSPEVSISNLARANGMFWKGRKLIGTLGCPVGCEWSLGRDLTTVRPHSRLEGVENFNVKADRGFTVSTCTDFTVFQRYSWEKFNRFRRADENVCAKSVMEIRVKMYGFSKFWRGNAGHAYLTQPGCDRTRPGRAVPVQM